MRRLFLVPCSFPLSCLALTLLATADAGATSGRKNAWLNAHPSACATLRSAASACTLCHLPGSDPDNNNLNGYGADYTTNWVNYGALDSDGDGVTNAQEILDCTFPGDAESRVPNESGSWGAVKSLYR
ncbi:MAG: hypothetical protein HGA75_17395 [Thiobacillus sp.]|nr:hypothetical protein [Thiobacillus sp.]